jgi:crotonobetainyl-CoA:carnitine CoA-transferase CaiB-like acyl-CoA transferase
MLPLAGLRVLDLSRILTGPFASMILSDPPVLAGGESAYYAAVNRNKRSLTLDLKHPEGQAILWRLVERADVLIENFRPGVLDKLGFSAAHCRARNPRLIYVSITAFGEESPYRDRAGYDMIVQGLSGIQAVTGEEDGRPMRVGFSVGDIGAGMYAVIGVLLALIQRERTGEGDEVETTLLGALLSWQTYHAQSFFATGEEPRRLGSRHGTVVPYQAFEAADGWLNVAVGNEPMWRRLCLALDRPDLADDPRFASNAARVAHRTTLIPMLEEVFRTRTVAAWLLQLERHAVAAGPIRGVGEAWSDPVVAALGLLARIPHPTAREVHTVATPLRLTRATHAPPRHPPLLGEHTEEVLAELGLSEREIRRLRQEGVV